MPDGLGGWNPAVNLTINSGPNDAEVDELDEKRAESHEVKVDISTFGKLDTSGIDNTFKSTFHENQTKLLALGQSNLNQLQQQQVDNTGNPPPPQFNNNQQ